MAFLTSSISTKWRRWVMSASGSRLALFFRPPNPLLISSVIGVQRIARTKRCTASLRQRLLSSATRAVLLSSMQPSAERSHECDPLHRLRCCCCSRSFKALEGAAQLAPMAAHEALRSHRRLEKKAEAVKVDEPRNNDF